MIMGSEFCVGIGLTIALMLHIMHVCSKYDPVISAAKAGFACSFRAGTTRRCVAFSLFDRLNAKGLSPEPRAWDA